MGRRKTRLGLQSRPHDHPHGAEVETIHQIFGPQVGIRESVGQDHFPAFKHPESGRPGSGHHPTNPGPETQPRFPPRPPLAFARSALDEPKPSTRPASNTNRSVSVIACGAPDNLSGAGPYFVTVQFSPLTARATRRPRRPPGNPRIPTESVGRRRPVRSHRPRASG